MFATIANAMAPGGAPGGGAQGGGLTQTLVLLIPMFLIFYLLIIRPQSKRAKEHQTFLGGLKRGDDVVTSGGILGKIVGISEQIVTLEVGQNTRIRVLRNQISSHHKVDGGEAANSN
jgi:preprotein translocase subunit YajC